MSSSWYFPYVEKLQNSPLKAREKTLVNIVSDHLNDIISPFLKQLSNAQMLLTPQEMQVATLVKDGKTSKEIANILNVTEATINFHRKNLREKFGLKKHTHRAACLPDIAQLDIVQLIAFTYQLDVF